MVDAPEWETEKAESPGETNKRESDYHGKGPFHTWLPLIASYNQMGHLKINSFTLEVSALFEDYLLRHN